MPRLAGVFHAAGILDDGIVAHQTPDRIAAVMAPKTAGAWNLHELTAGLSLDFFILCSSVASVFGSPSQAGYSAGNAFLDALAHYRRARGLPALSVNWGAWADAGMAARVEQQGHRRALSGVRSMPAQDCLQFLEQATASLHPQVVIADIDWAEFSPSSHLTASFAPGNRELAASTSADDLLERLEVAPALGRRKILVDYLRDLTLRILGLDSSHVVDDRQPLVKIGLDSLMAIEFRNRLSTVLKRSLSATLLFDCPSISSLADFLEGPKTAKLEAEKDEAADRVLELVTGLSESQAEELLRQELERS
jgi:acyl carrier protein